MSERIFSFPARVPEENDFKATSQSSVVTRECRRLQDTLCFIINLCLGIYLAIENLEGEEIMTEQVEKSL